ncbi:MAG: hypothetical protein WHW07_03015 [Bacteroidales bacterium]|jgi:DNA-binding NtrC family response regulator|nr:hypothetical protein [Bacteroidales bacterium]HOL98888.1 hypothetical protein [Bacteroidales bacterium]HPD24729.1 hypothetical protein [Bacteroidales bacterium]HRT00474.1 hypothetical protein [Bacteroidales bacterium]HRT80948.1 hypothetical protein [Bacteroidales bacterium]
MKSKKQIKIYVVDNDVDELEKFRDNFKPEFNYILNTFSSVQMFLNKLKSDSKDRDFKIVLLDKLVSSRGMQTNSAIEIVPKIKSIDRNAEVIIFADSENIELKATNSAIKSVIYIKKDKHYFDILYPIMERLVSDYELKKARKKLKKSIVVSLTVIIIAAVIFVFGMFYFG